MNKPDLDLILRRLLAESRNHDSACILLSNDFYDPYGIYQIMAGFGAAEELFIPSDFDKNRLWMGICSFDLKNELLGLNAAFKQSFPVPDYWFFSPEKHYILDRQGNLKTNFSLPPPEIVSDPLQPSLSFQCTTPRHQYLGNVEKIKNCIKNGDFYEMNYCIEFVSGSKPEPLQSFYRMNTVSPAPFAAFVKYKGNYLLCQSPERFLARRDDILLSQPIKGTRPRKEIEEDDEMIKRDLENSVKDRAENVMIVDLTRNDLSKVCLPGTVEVTELCKVYSFSHVHQMISTINGKLKEGTGWPEILRATFPMGSMTGAPKLQVLKDTLKFENFSRGWYSGSAGYFYGDNFDLNVVIRSLQIPSSGENAFYHTGGAITFDSVAEDEYEECLTKAAGMFRSLNAQLVSNL